MRLGAAMAAVAILTACSASIDQTTTGSLPEAASQVEMLALPGGRGTVPMPPAWMRQQLETRMSEGRVPGYVEVPTRKMRESCATDEDLLGCMVDYKGLKVTYIRSGLSADVKHMVLLHEYAHDLYGWRHD